MFTFLHKNSTIFSRLLVFVVLIGVYIIHLGTGLFIGGVLLVMCTVAAIVLSSKLFLIYYASSLFLFVYATEVSGVPLRQFVVQGVVFITCLSLAAFAGEEISRYIERIDEKNNENCQLTTQLIHAFIRAIDAKDHYLQNHSFNVSYYSRKICEQLGYDRKKTEEICVAALFHDIGKLTVSEKILNKPEQLSDEEWTEMKGHPVKGQIILKDISQLSFMLDYIKYHHRHYDGAGYPNDCPKEQVPFESRIIAVADAFDAMTSDRPYRKALPIETANAELRKYSGSQFDPTVVQALLQAEVKPVKLPKIDLDLHAVME